MLQENCQLQNYFQEIYRRHSELNIPKEQFQFKNGVNLDLWNDVEAEIQWGRRELDYPFPMYIDYGGTSKIDAFPFSMYVCKQFLWYAGALGRKSGGVAVEGRSKENTCAALFVFWTSAMVKFWEPYTACSEPRSWFWRLLPSKPQLSLNGVLCPQRLKTGLPTVVLQVFIGNSRKTSMQVKEAQREFSVFIVEGERRIYRSGKKEKTSVGIRGFSNSSWCTGRFPKVPIGKPTSDKKALGLPLQLETLWR